MCVRVCGGLGVSVRLPVAQELASSFQWVRLHSMGNLLGLTPSVIFHALFFFIILEKILHAC